MKHYSILFAITVWLLVTFDGRAQGAAFTYQGRLNEGANPASGLYDFQFTLYDSADNLGGIVAGPLTHSATAVNNGLFTVTLDFGANVFSGANRWLEIRVRAQSATFATLSPRQAVTPVPYATYAMTPAGPQGPSGPLGPAGVAGPKGEKGDSGSAGPKGANGDTGLAGPKGDSGLTGSAGPKGDKGDTGSAGATGAQGPTGPSGVAGPKGDKGDTGLAGSAGPKGDKGNKGDSGPAGATGPQGTQGIQGLAGPVGTTGPQGQIGSAGATGPKGDKGDKGDSGPAGPQGPEGPLSPNVALLTGENIFNDKQTFYGQLRLHSVNGFSQSSLGAFAIDAPEIYGGRFFVGGDGRVVIGGNPDSLGYRLRVAGDTRIEGNSTITGYSDIHGDNFISGSVHIGENAVIADYRLSVAGNTRIDGNSTINGDSVIYGDSVIRGTETVFGNVAIASPSSLNFGAQNRQMLNLYNAQYGIGVQENTEYFRSSGSFRWYEGGAHHDNPADAANGTLLMRLFGSGDLEISGSFGSLSDRNAKQDFEPINTRDVLEKVAALPLVKWSFKTDASTRHIGPMAQDFYAAFNVGADDKHITTVDADGVALAAIQGLNAKVAELEKRLSELEQLISDRSGGDK